MAEAAGSSGDAPPTSTDSHQGHREGFGALALGAIGVVFGDIGTSPIYAMREALAHSRADVSPELSVLGVISLITWALVLVVSVKYVAFLMRADNKGEGGTLALMALAQRALSKPSGVVLFLGMVGAALFYGDGVITPAISVLGAVEGLRDAPGVSPELGALVLAHPEARGNPFFDMIPVAVYWPVLLMATAASVIASQAVITGAFSMTQQAVQLGLLPRMDIRRTSETQAGQIYVPQVNTFLMIGVIALLFTFQTSSNMAAAYGIAVTGSMFVDTLLFFVIIRHLWKKPLWMAALAAVGFGLLDIVFISSNMLKLPQGAWLPLVMGALLVVIMWTWNRGTRILSEKTHQDSVALADLSDMLLARPPHRASGSAVFLTSDPDVAPVALMHNLKHNKVLHERNIILTVITAQTPRVRDEDRIRIEPLNADFKKLTVSYGFMESPNIPRAMTLCRQQGLKFDIMATSFFLGRRSVVASASSGMPLWQDKLFIFLMRNAANPTDFYKIPPGRVVELGTQVTV